MGNQTYSLKKKQNTDLMYDFQTLPELSARESIIGEEWSSRSIRRVWEWDDNSSSS